MGEDEVTVTSGLHAQLERTKKQKRKEEAAADDCDDGEEVSRVRLRYPRHLRSCTITLCTLAHTLAPSHTVRCLDRDTAGDCIRRAVLSGLRLRYPKHLACMRARGYGHCLRTRRRLRLENAVTRIAGERAKRKEAGERYIYICTH